MGNANKDESIKYDGKRYYKSTSGIWMETSSKCEKSSPLDERNIKTFAKKVAKVVKKPTSTIKIPFERNIQYEVEKNVAVTEGFFIFKSTRMQKIKEEKTGTKVEYKDVPVDGWILKTYYMNVDSVVDTRCYEQEVTKWFYVLKKDGSLSVFELSYAITAPKTNREQIQMYHKLTEYPMRFYLDADRLVWMGSAYLLDFKPVKWEVSRKRSCYEILYFNRNYPMTIGQCGSKGESYLIQETGTGIMEALKKLEKRRVKK